jgi:hypothetical protein
MQNGPAYPVRSGDNVLRLLIMLREQGELRAEAASALGVAPRFIDGVEGSRPLRFGHLDELAGHLQACAGAITAEL